MIIKIIQLILLYARRAEAGQVGQIQLLGMSTCDLQTLPESPHEALRNP
jgi:hypothetical protein